MKPLEIKENVYLVGAIDWDRRHFHGYTYTTRTGTTYNSYLIVDDKITLVDTVLEPFAGEMIDKISQIVPPEKIDNIIINHGEADHSGALPELLEIAPKAKVFGTKICLESLERHYHSKINFQIVKTGDFLETGNKKIMFIEAKMLHWPDTMFSYLVEDKILFSNDVFGQHYASSERFDDEVDEGILMYESARYYANIMWPYSMFMHKKMEEIGSMKIDIDMIAPSHGIIWRNNPGKAIKSHLEWSQDKTKRKVIVVYETMYGATREMARKIVEGLVDNDVTVKLYDINESDRSDIITEMLDAGGFIIGSSTHDKNVLPTMAGFLEYLKGISPKGRLVAAFGSYGWASSAVRTIENLFQSLDMEIALPGLTFKYFASEEELKKCYDYGVKFSERL